MRVALVGALWLFVPLVVAQESPRDSASRGSEQGGHAVRQSVEHGEYMQYLPANDPRGILVIVHGSLAKDEPATRAAEVFIERWIDVAEQRRLVLLAPAFDQENFGGHAGPGGGYRGLFGRRVGADEFVNAVVDTTRKRFPSLPERFYLYGHSAGGQFVSRYVVRHPNRVAAAVISAAGTFAFPDPDVAWTNGMGPLRRTMRWSDDEPWQEIDIQPDREAWLAAATLPITVIVGAEDTGKIDPIPGNPGENHVERGRLWVREMNALARRHNKLGKVRFKKVPGVAHNSAALTPYCVEAFWGD